MIETAQDMYWTFLDGIKKPNTSQVTPAGFNRIINDWGQDEWLKRNVSEEAGVELNQKQLDDLDIIRCVTDGNDEYPDGVILYPIAPETLQTNRFVIPKFETGSINNITTIGFQDYPRYLRLLNIMFKITYVNNVCGYTGVSNYLEAKVMRTDQRTVILNSPYRKPTDERMYYEMLHGKIRLITETDSIPYCMRLEYLRYPKEIFFDEADPLGGSVDCEFGSQQSKEIVEIAVRTY